MKLTVIIATLGRSEILAQTVADISRQSRLPDEIIIVGTCPEDFPDKPIRSPIPVRTIIGPRGTTLQRNTGIEAALGCDVLVFLDDDFVMASDFIAKAESLFRTSPDIVAATGHVLADGIHGPGIPFTTALSRLRESQIPPANPAIIRTYNAYGCNMLFRTETIRRHGLRFDARLPLYAWLEDVDFSRQLGKYGRIVRAEALRGIHLGIKLGRGSGKRFGYSQIANPVYLISKRTMETRRALIIMARNFASNLVKSLRPEPEVDRRGRLAGNLIAIRDLLTGRLRPERVTELE